MKAGISTGLRVAAWSASSLILVGVVAGSATAATSHAKHTTTKSSTAKDTTTGSGTDSDGSGPGAGRPAGPPNVLHGLATIETKDGSFENVASQVGTVSAVSATSITVVSADKYSATYAIDDSTTVVKDGSKSEAGDVATGDTVMVQAEQADQGYTAEAIFDGKPPAPAGGPGGPGHGGPGGPGGEAGPPAGGPGGQGGGDGGSDGS